MRHINKHTCSRAVDFEVENGIITRCQFIGGCSGNTPILSGIDCGGRGTSCPDQLAKGLQEYLNTTSGQEV